MADRLDIQNVLGQMRAIREQMQTNQAVAPTGNATNPGQANPVNGANFAQQIQQARESIQSTDPTPQTQDVASANRAADAQMTPPSQEVPSFGDMFESAFQTVNENQQAASELASRYEMGDPKVDLPEVMIALQKSSVSFQAMTQVRNKMVEAYKEIMNMPI